MCPVTLHNILPIDVQFFFLNTFYLYYVHLSEKFNKLVLVDPGASVNQTLDKASLDKRAKLSHCEVLRNDFFKKNWHFFYHQSSNK